MSTNTPNGRYTTTPHHIEDMIMKTLPKSITDWLRYEAPGNYDVVELFKAHRAGVSEERILEELRGDARVKTMRAYGDLHPQLPYAQQEFSRGRNPYANQERQAA